jgi:hypothetical protein
MASRVCAVAQSLTIATRRAAARAGLGASGASRSLPIRRDTQDVRELWDGPGRHAVLGGPPVRRASIGFGPDLGEWGTTVTVALELEVPLPRPAAQAIAGKAIRRLKSLAETGEVPTTARNPSARAHSEVAARETERGKS